MSRMIAEQLVRQTQDEEEEVNVVEEDGSAPRDTEEDDQTQSDLDSDRNQSFHISGENIDLDDLDENIAEPHDDSNNKSEEEVKEDDADVTFSKKKRSGELDTTTAITTMLSELASESDSRETVGR